MKKNRTIKQGVYLVYKEIGETPLESINKFRKEGMKENPELDFLPITYAGRLDPMAEGVLILLSGEETKNKEKYLGLTKTYEFEILWGAETDTLDLLGLVLESVSENVQPNVERIEDYLRKSVGKFEQMYPAYSSRPVGGKPLFEWAREGKIGGLEIPKHEVEIFESKYLGRREIAPDDLLKEIFSKINLVNGDFRQEEIKKSWDSFFAGRKSNFVVDKIQLRVSGGFYVRQFVSDLGKVCDVPAVTLNIKRNAVGDYAIAK
ncbi:MAG: hypothetical protein WAW92_00385 [Minisyncoccia bacterium]